MSSKFFIFYSLDRECKKNHWYGQITLCEVVCRFLVLLHLEPLIFSLSRLGGNSSPNRCRAQHSPVLQFLVNTRNNTLTLTAHQEMQPCLLCIKIPSFEYLWADKAATCRGVTGRPWHTHPALAAGVLCLLCSGGTGIFTLAFEIPHPNLHMLWKL